MCHLMLWEAEPWHNNTVWHPSCGSLEVVYIASCVAAMPLLTCTSAAEVLQCWGDALPESGP